MVCNRCVLVVRQEFEKAGLYPDEVNMGEVVLKKDLSKSQFDIINTRLQGLGFEILDNRRQKQIENIKKLLIEQVQAGEIQEHFSLGEFLSKNLNKDYTQISRLFSEVESITLEQFFILQKIEKVKEWLTYDELTLSSQSGQPVKARHVCLYYT